MGGWDSGTWKDACKSMPSEMSASLEALQDPGWSHREHECSGTQSRDGKGRGEQGGLLEEKQQDACFAALLGHLHVQLDTKGIVSLFVSLTQYKQITHGPMELAKHRFQCIQKHVSYKEHIHQTIYKAYSPKQLSVNASLGVQHAADLREQPTVVMGPALSRTRNDLNTASTYVPQQSLQEQLHQSWKPEIQECVMCPCWEKKAPLTVIKD